MNTEYLIVNVFLKRVCFFIGLFLTSLITFASTEDSLLKILEYQEDTSRISTLNELSYYYLQEDAEKSVLMALIALKESQELPFSPGIILSHRRLGAAYTALSKYDSAQYHLFQALQISEDNDSPTTKIRILIGLGNVNFRIGAYLKALNTYTEGKELALQLNDSNYLTSLYTNIGICYENLDQNEEALTHYFEGLKYANGARNKNNYPNLLLNIGSAFFYANQDDSAFAYNEKAKDEFSKINNETGLASTYLNEGVFYEETGQPEMALNSYHHGLNHFKTTQNFEQLTIFTQNIMLAHGVMGNVDSMYSYYSQSQIYAQKLLNARTENAIHEISVKYEVEKKEQNLKLVQQEKEKVELANSLQRNTIYILMGVILIITLLVYIFYKQNQEKQRLAALQVQQKNQEIEGLIKEQELITYSAEIAGIEKERKRVAQDLHDKIGGILATIKLQFEGNAEITDQNLAHVKSLINESIKSVRSISHDLADGRVNENGLIISIERLQQTLLDSGKMNFELFLDHYDSSLPPAGEREVYKIILEMLSNTLKHAQANHMVLQINVFDQILHLTFEDNGVGFDPNETKNGIGLRGISQRVNNLKGSWNLDSRPQHGTTIVIEIPVE